MGLSATTHDVAHELASGKQESQWGGFMGREEV